MIFHMKVPNPTRCYEQNLKSKIKDEQQQNRNNPTTLTRTTSIGCHLSLLGIRSVVSYLISMDLSLIKLTQQEVEWSNIDEFSANELQFWTHSHPSSNYPAAIGIYYVDMASRYLDDGAFAPAIRTHFPAAHTAFTYILFTNTYTRYKSMLNLHCGHQTFYCEDITVQTLFTHRWTTQMLRDGPQSTCARCLHRYL